MDSTVSFKNTFLPDLRSGLVVFLVALPLCLGIALASNAPLISGLVSGIVGGLIVTWVSGSQTSVSGPAAGLTAIVAAQIAILGSFEAFLAAVVMAGVIQIALGLSRAGFIASFFPLSVIKGLLAAIGLILILKQIPHLFGHDMDPEGDMSFIQPDSENTFSELLATFYDLHPGAALVGVVSLLFLLFGQRSKLLQKSPLPLALVVVVFGVVVNQFLPLLGAGFYISSAHLVSVPIANGVGEFLSLLASPNFSGVFGRSEFWMAAITIAAVASLETLLNIEAVDKIDPQQRVSPPNRELLAQGVGNMACGFLGGIPLTSVIVRSSVNINTGNKTKLSSFYHGCFLVVCVVGFPQILNLIPLSSLAAILFATGIKLASPALMKQMVKGGPHQWLPFFVTILAILFTDLLIGVGIGFLCAIGFILHSNYRRPLIAHSENRLTTDVLRVELPLQMSFLSRAALLKTFQSMKKNSHILIDASKSTFIDPDIVGLIYDFKTQTGPAKQVKVSLTGFEDYPLLKDEIQFADFATPSVQEAMTPVEVLGLLKEGNQRFVENRMLSRDWGQQVKHGTKGQNPLAVVLSCIDSRAPVEVIFDTGLGELFSVRMAGNVTSSKVIGSVEYCVGAAKTKLIVVMGHTGCGAVTATVDAASKGYPQDQFDELPHVLGIAQEIGASISVEEQKLIAQLEGEKKQSFIDEVARKNVLESMKKIQAQSSMIRKGVETGKFLVVGAMYDIQTGKVAFLE